MLDWALESPHTFLANPDLSGIYLNNLSGCPTFKSRAVDIYISQKYHNRPLTSCLFVYLNRLDQMFTDAFSKDHQLMHADPKRNLYLACALMVRGNVLISDLRRNIERYVDTLTYIFFSCSLVEDT